MVNPPHRPLSDWLCNECGRWNPTAKQACKACAHVPGDGHRWTRKMYRDEAREHAASARIGSLKLRRMGL